MKQTLSLIALLSAAVFGQAQAKDVRIVVAGEPKELGTVASVEYLKLREPLTKAAGVPIRIISNSNLSELARGSRTGEYDVMWVPSHLAASALKHGFQLGGSDGRMEKFVVITQKDIQDFSQLKGKILYLPQEDSLATYVGTALLSENGIELNNFKRVFTRAGTYEVGMFAIASGTADATIVEEKVAEAWLTQNPGKARILGRSQPVPGQTIVFRQDLAQPVREKLLAWFAKPTVQLANLPNGFTAANSTVYQYVAGLGHYTPTELSGVKKINANETTELMKKGAILVDVRSQDEYRAKHIPGAIWLGYKESSTKSVNFNPAQDSFDLDKLEAGKSYIFACNGPECWKSYKASKAAAASKRFKEVYWFRGGLPEWEASGLAVGRSS